jgi:transcriptional regulator with XRE-family HTH domain
MTESQAPIVTATLRAIRSKPDLTQGQLAERLGVSFATVNRWERGQPCLKSASVESTEIARETEGFLACFPNAPVNADEQRRLRAALYRPLLALTDESARIVDLIIASVTN